MPSWLTDNSAFILAFPIGGKSRNHVKQLLNLTNDQAKYIDELPEYGTAIFRDRRFHRRYLVDVPCDLEITTITQDEIKQIMQSFIEKLHAELDAKEKAYEEKK